MHEPIAPAGLPEPPARYAHAVLVTAPTRWLHTSGMVPVGPDGSVPAGIGAQARTVWANLALVLAEAGMGADDVVSVTTYVAASAPANGLAQVMAARDEALEGRRVASTLLTVPALAQPAWLVEIAVVAAQ